MLTIGRKILLVVGAALIDRCGQVLVQQRPADKQHGGLWEFPGGKVEANEAPEAALVRELSEELGITVSADALTPIGFSTASGIVLLLYAAREWHGTPIASDGAQVTWVTPAALTDLAMPPADVPLIPRVQALG